ncbi:hypothetical protein MRX96_057837 [Rhipicephalus microplus]|uniref:uncharacterized protein LOC119165869 n=1 Tax=Rhipicephalus microplus TaxID=6941 RepID=UPI00188993CB|nr:uncharacterized protein LOC119165869 [Rhipicephalus microplus]
MESNRKQCGCMLCPECENIIRAKVRLWLQEQPFSTEVEDQNCKPEAAREAGFSGVPLLAAKYSEAADAVHAYAYRLLECKLDSVESTDSGSKTDTSVVGCCSGKSISEDGDTSVSQVDDGDFPIDPLSSPSQAVDSGSIDKPLDGL